MVCDSIPPGVYANGPIPAPKVLMPGQVNGAELRAAEVDALEPGALEIRIEVISHDPTVVSPAGSVIAAAELGAGCGYGSLRDRVPGVLRRRRHLQQRR